MRASGIDDHDGFHGMVHPIGNGILPDELDPAWAERMIAVDEVARLMRVDGQGADEAQDGFALRAANRNGRQQIEMEIDGVVGHLGRIAAIQRALEGVGSEPVRGVGIESAAFERGAIGGVLRVSQVEEEGHDLVPFLQGQGGKGSLDFLDAHLG